MDHHHEQGPHIPIRGSVPRLSKLPMPRAVTSTDNLKLSARSSTVPNIHHDDLRKTSHIPRPAGPSTPLGENFNQSLRSRYGWADKPANPRSRSPVRDALRDVQSSAMDTTPPSSNTDAPVFEAGNENPTAIKSPILSPTAARPDSPSKRPFRPPGRTSPMKDMTPLPPVVSPGEIYTPPKAFVKGQRSKIAKPLREPRRTASSIFESQSKEPSHAPTAKYLAQTVKLKPTFGDRRVASPTLSSKPSLSSIFREPISAKPSGKLAVSGFDSPALLKPRSRGENSIAPTTPPKANSKAKRATSTQQGNTVTAAAKETATTSSPKSSAALRDTIAKAKAAKRKARDSAGTSNIPSTDASNWPTGSMDDEPAVGGDNKGLMRKRIQQATTSGQLNIAAMKLKEIPTEVSKMYDPENSTTNWAEMVDLTKLNASDNEIEELGEDFFPDLIRDDDETNHQFLGLEVLDLHRNHLQHLPLGFTILERLTTLNLSGNKLANNAFDVISGIPNLKELFVAENLLDGKLDLTQKGGARPLFLETLEVLDLHGNSVTSFGDDGLFGFKKLRVLNLAANKFSSLKASTLPTWSLTELNVSKNGLSGVLFECESAAPRDETFKELRNLDASYNRLERWAVNDKIEVWFPNIRSISVTGNKMTSLPSLEGCQNLVSLEVADNQLDELPSDFAQLRALRTANLANNNIRLIPSELATMANLTSLNLVGNPLREKKYLTMVTSELKLDLEKKLDSPEHLDDSSQTSISSSQYRFTPSNGILDLSSQSLATTPIAEIDLSQEIHTLKLSNNDLSSFPTELLSHPSIKYSLKSLDLSHNPQLHPTEYLTSELFLPNLKSIYIVSTGLTSLDGLTTYLRAPELKELNISCHRLAGHVPWVRAWWPKVTTLLATDNWFTSVDVEGVRGLEILDIRNNEIEVLPPKLGLLGNLPDSKEKVPGRLRVLEASGNRFRVPRLAVVEKGTEAVLKDLRRMVKQEEVTEEWMGVL
ncbi:hypothetical protein H2200_011261 [Cladophialophora chaetospira]|uniref:Leucine-rich repeat-containing protein 40 n=1 Tax=Cladophialophora chaetospira TaxID=386627 RepID=A0AA38X0B4_9EURO|nr:hypothetical protein H2200_011261 [Cladophialophora chaetospira]